MALLKLSLLFIFAVTAANCLDEETLRFKNENCEQYRHDFEAFKEQHTRTYATLKEEEGRFQIFCQNMKEAKALQEEDRGTAEYGVTKFADMSKKEFQDQYLGLKATADSITSWPAAKIPAGTLPKYYNWEEHGAVSSVKDQGRCGSCWAFSTAGNIEGQWAIKHKKLYSLSAQELVDCDKVDHGCRGGLPSNAYRVIKKLGGLEQSSDYGYVGRREKCTFDEDKVVAKVSRAVAISKNETDIALWLYKNGPISIGINARNMQMYRSGVAHPSKKACDPGALDHGVLIVGFGVDKQGVPFWIIKNSWGESWGVGGYYFVYRGDGTCGLNTMCTSAIVP